VDAEGEKMSKLLQPTQVDETQVLEEVDRILALEREMKRTQIGLMVRIKNTLTPAQQAKLMEIRNRTAGE
jgi:Spy/CpxP family protein refolding chaperone